MKRYQYLVAYSFRSGTGRTFVTCSDPIDSVDRVESVERSIQDNNGLDSVAMISFQLLRSYDDGVSELAATEQKGAV